MIKEIISKYYKQVMMLSPRIEILLRIIYWKNVKRFKKFRPRKVPKHDPSKHVDFGEIERWFREQGVKEGDLLIVHSSYGELKCTGLSPDEIVDRLLALVGPTGTLCMPVIRKFKGEPEGEDLLDAEYPDIVLTYKVRTTKIVSGLLPYCLMQKENAVVSRFPYNPLCAVGPLAKEMMEHNLDGDHPSPHGKDSAWKFCYDHGAKICFIGTDWYTHNTIIHVAEEAFGDWHWPDHEWYDICKFNIIDGKETIYKEVYNRKMKWGTMRLPGVNNIVVPFEKNGLVKVTKIEDYIQLGIEEAKTVVDFLRAKSKEKKGYPYL